MLGEQNKKIVELDFGLFSPEEIKKCSVVHVIHPESIENGLPKESGLIDLRMGTIEKNLNCLTCNNNMFDCVGHFGHVELCKPMFHIGYISKIKKLLECVCFYCSKIKDNKAVKSAMSLEDAWNALKTKTVCASEGINGEKIGCCNKQPVIKKEGLNLIAFVKGSDEDGKMILNGEKVYNIFRKIEDEDLKILGFNKGSFYSTRPENMLLTVLLVAPPCMRPSILTDGLRAEDDITHKYADIVKSNACLKKYEQEGAPAHIVRDYEQLLQFHLATLINNEMAGQPIAMQKSGRPIKSISARLKGKEGRVRGNLMGKRVDFSARSVISPDACLELDQVGVPLSIAMIHTFPEKVTRANVNFLQNLVNKGPNDYPGANYVIRNDGQRIDLRYNKFNLRLEQGFIVERHILDDDIVLFNRQPSLHKMSMMGHRAKVMKNKTFRLNLSVTTPYNADFDGDEMNLHMPQSYNAKSELMNLASVTKNIISPQSNKPVIGIVQDTLVGVRLFTLNNCFFTKGETMGLLFACDLPAQVVSGVMENPTIENQGFSLWSGKSVMGAILPEGICLKNSSVYVQNGKIIRGFLNKKAFVAGGLIHIACNDYGTIIATKLINNVQKLIRHFMYFINTFTVGVGDTIVSNSIIEECKTNIGNAISQVDTVIKEAKSGLMEKSPGLDISATFESKVNVILNKARNYNGEISMCNNMNAMIEAGSKGSKINIAQMTSCVGQQNVEGKRIPFGFEKRSLPHNLKYDFSAQSRGFVANSYLSGMTPQEFYFHAMGGREGLIDTAIKTAETGYIQRRLIKAMEDAIIKEDKSVRNGFGKIYQFLYGEDGFDAKYLETLNLPKPKKEECYIDMFIEKEKYGIQSELLDHKVIEMLRSDMELQKRMDAEWNFLEKTYSSLVKNSVVLTYTTPVNIERIILNVTNRNTHKNVPLSPWTVFEEIEKLETKNTLWNFYLRLSLNVRKCLLTLNRVAFFKVIEEIRIKFSRAMVDANETVGTLAAQSVGEPATQMTLNTFHLAGVASTVTMGVPRVNEIINTAKNIKTPSMKIFLKNQALETARNMRNKIEYLLIKDIYSKLQVVYDPNVMSTVLEEDKHFVSEYFEMPDDIEYDKCSLFLFRITLDKYQMIGKGITIEDVVEKINRYFMRKVHVISTAMSDEKLIIRIRLILDDFSESGVDTLEHFKSVSKNILFIHVQGIDGIKKAHISSLDANENSFYLQTDGVSFSQILSHENVDAYKTIANDLHVIYETLGVEALRETIITELRAVIEGNGSYVNLRHIGLLADVMTVCGYPAGITRHGVNREVKAGALKRASFEETVDILLEAAVNAESDPSYGITENIMMGQIAPLGTGNVQLLLDKEKLATLNVTKTTTIANSVVLNSPAYTSDSDVVENEIIGKIQEDRGEFSPEYEHAEVVASRVAEFNMTPGSGVLYSSPGSGAMFSSPGSNSYAPGSTFGGSTFFQGAGSQGYYTQNTTAYQPGSGLGSYMGSGQAGSASMKPGNAYYNAYSVGSGQYSEKHDAYAVSNYENESTEYKEESSSEKK